MNTPQHTPGPWGYDRPTGEIYHADGDVMPRIATVDLDNVPADQFDADLYLIAAAPELLAACEAMLSAFGGNYPDWLTDEAQKMSTAIAKAQGGAA